MPARARRTRKTTRPVLVRDLDNLLGEALKCHDRSLGHDWDRITWEDGPEVKTKAGPVYVCYRIATCARCGTVRREIFDQDDSFIAKRRNAYVYDEAYHQAGRLTQSEVHTALHDAATTRPRARKGARR